jgi:hypothetical protein
MVIGLPGDDLVRTVDLLEQHDAGELVGQRDGAERQPVVGLLEVDAERPAQKRAKPGESSCSPSAASSETNAPSGTRRSARSPSRTSTSSIRACPCRSFV